MIANEQLMKLVTRTAAHIRRRPRKDGAPGDSPRCTKGYGHILDLLSEGEGLSQQEIALQMDIRPQSVSEAITSMEARGYVIRKPDPEDKRVARILITDEGKEHRQQMKAERRTFANQFFQILSEEEKETLAGLLSKLLQGQPENKKHHSEQEGSL